MPRLVIVALGALGGSLLEACARRAHFDEIVVATRDHRRAQAKVNNVRVGAALEGRFPNIVVAPFDMYAHDAGAKLAALAPDVLFASPSMLPWWRLAALPPPLAEQAASAPFATFLPMHLLPMMALQRAMEASKLRCPWVGASYPDVVNHILGCIGTPPTCGTGNLQEAIPKVHFALQKQHSFAPSDLRIWLVAQHAFEYFCYSDGAAAVKPPFLLRAELSGVDVSQEASNGLFDSFPIPYELDLNNITVSASLAVLEALSGGAPQGTHVPAPNGLLGGYPVRVNENGVELRLDGHWSTQQAIDVNRESLPFDGLVDIADDGSVTFDDTAHATLSALLGAQSATVSPAEMPALANALYTRLQTS